VGRRVEGKREFLHRSVRKFFNRKPGGKSSPSQGRKIWGVEGRAPGSGEKPMNAAFNLQETK